MEQRLVVKEAKKLMKLIGQDSELQNHLIGEIRSQAFLKGIGEDNTVNQLVMASLEAKIAGNGEFYNNQYIMQLI
jgi:hypothetical protein